MNGKKSITTAARPKNGFTLVELIITVAISGVLFYFIGMLMLVTQSSFSRAVTKVTVEDDFRYAKTRMEYIIRNSTGPIHGTGTQADPLEVRRHSDNIPERFFLKSNQIFLRVSGFPDEVLISNVISFNVVFSGTNSNTMQVTIDQNNKGILKSGSFAVKCRNLDQ